MPEPGRLLGSRADPRRLIGRWQFERTLFDLASGEHGSAAGTLIVSPADAGLLWIEHGELCWSGARVPVSRELRLVPAGYSDEADGADEADEWLVTFADGRPFHPWKPGSAVEHLCGPDLYRGKIDVLGDEEMRIEWTVRGPRKDHRYLTHCRRISTADEQAVSRPVDRVTA